MLQALRYQTYVMDTCTFSNINDHCDLLKLKLTVAFDEADTLGANLEDFPQPPAQILNQDALLIDLE